MSKRFKKGTFGWRITKTYVRDGRIWQYHSTKGWRSYKA